MRTRSSAFASAASAERDRNAGTSGASEIRADCCRNWRRVVITLFLDRIGAGCTGFMEDEQKAAKEAKMSLDPRVLSRKHFDSAFANFAIFCSNGLRCCAYHLRAANAGELPGTLITGPKKLSSLFRSIQFLFRRAAAEGTWFFRRHCACRCI